MKLTFKDIPFAIHACHLVNFHLAGDIYHFRLAIHGYKAKMMNDKITDEHNESLILDIILYKVQVKEIYFATADFRLVQSTVLDFYIDDNGDAEITLFDVTEFTLKLKCESDEVIPIKIIKNTQWYSKDITTEDFFTIE
jgi:hypothetical protein